MLSIAGNRTVAVCIGCQWPLELEFATHRCTEYPLHDRTIRVTQCGPICIGHRKINFSTVFAGQYVGVREVADEVWLVSFMQYDLGFFDRVENRVEPVGDNPFAPKLLPMSPEKSVTYVSGMDL